MVVTDDDHPLSNVAARTEIRRLWSEGRVTTSRHCEKRMLERRVSPADVNNMLRAGHVSAVEFENGSWRYTVGTPRMSVVVVLDLDDDSVIVVTVWRS